MGQQVTQTDASGRTTAFAYYAFGQQNGRTLPAAHDLAGALIDVEDVTVFQNCCQCSLGCAARLGFGIFHDDNERTDHKIMSHGIFTCADIGFVEGSALLQLEDGRDVTMWAGGVDFDGF